MYCERLIRNLNFNSPILQRNTLFTTEIYEKAFYTLFLKKKINKIENIYQWQCCTVFYQYFCKCFPIHIDNSTFDNCYALNHPYIAG